MSRLRGVTQPYCWIARVILEGDDHGRFMAKRCLRFAQHHHHKPYKMREVDTHGSPYCITMNYL